jgi:MerR family mercuric resistance operon transcriptional regulator
MFAISEAARRSGVTIETIRYYERERVIEPAPRNASGRRVYREDDISRLRFIRNCRDLGFSIADIRSLQSLASKTEDACGSAKIVGIQHLENVRRKISDLKRLEKALDELVSNCSSRNSRCAMLEKLMFG